MENVAWGVGCEEQARHKPFGALAVRVLLMEKRRSNQHFSCLSSNAAYPIRTNVSWGRIYCVLKLCRVAQLMLWWKETTQQSARLCWCIVMDTGDCEGLWINLWTVQNECFIYLASIDKQEVYSIMWEVVSWRKQVVAFPNCGWRRWPQWWSFYHGARYSEALQCMNLSYTVNMSERMEGLRWKCDKTAKNLLSRHTN